MGAGKATEGIIAILCDPPNHGGPAGILEPLL